MWTCSKLSSVIISLWIVTLVDGGIPKRPPFRQGAQIMSILPENEKSMLAEKFRQLCQMRPLSSSGNEWSFNFQDTILNQINNPKDTFEEKFVKKFLVENVVNSMVSNCVIPGRSIGLAKIPKQDENDNSDIYEGLSNILTNVFSGNLFGVIQSSVGIRSPEGLSNTFSDVFRTILSNIGNAQESVNKGASSTGTGTAAAGTATNTNSGSDSSSSDS